MDKGKTLGERIYDELYKEITEGTLKQGQKLTLPMLKERFGVSHTPIREALSRLTAEGLVTYQTNCGMRVAELSEAEIREIFQFSAELEATAVRFLRTTFSLAPMLREMERLIREEREFLEKNDFKEWIALRETIHNIIYRYCGNRYLVEAAERIGARMELMNARYANEETFEEIYRRHVAIYEALQERDFERAAECVREHLQFAMEYVLDDYRGRS